MKVFTILFLALFVLAAMPLDALAFGCRGARIRWGERRYARQANRCERGAWFPRLHLRRCR